MTRAELLEALTVERFAPRPERPAHNEDGPTARMEAASRVVVVDFGGRRAS